MVTIILSVTKVSCVPIKKLRSDDAQPQGHFRLCFPQKVQELVALQFPSTLIHWENQVKQTALGHSDTATQNSLLVQDMMAFGYNLTGFAKVSNHKGLRQHCEAVRPEVHLLAMNIMIGTFVIFFMCTFVIQWLPVQTSVWKRHLETSISDLIATKPLCICRVLCTSKVLVHALVHFIQMVLDWPKS